MTFEQALNLMFDAHGEIVRNITFTDNSGLIGWLAGWIGRFLWTFGKRIKLILQLLGAKTEQEVIEVVLNMLKRRAALLRIVALVLAILLVVEWVGFLLWYIGLCLLFIEGSATSRLLPQDSRRERRKFKSKEVRVNSRRGPDKTLA